MSLKGEKKNRKTDGTTAAHLSGLKADGLEGCKGQMALVGELSEAADDAGKHKDGSRPNLNSNIKQLGTTRKNSLVVTSGPFLLVLRVTDSPSRTGLPVGGVESRESGHKVATVGRSGCCRQLLWRYRKNSGVSFVCTTVLRI